MESVIELKEQTTKKCLTEKIIEHRRLTGELFTTLLSMLQHYHDKLCSEDELCISLIL